MKANVIFKSCCSVTLELDNDKPYKTDFLYSVYLNDKLYKKDIYNNVISLYDLQPNTLYTVSFGGLIEPITFKTNKVSYVLNVKDFGAKGDGISNDTLAIQAAIVTCPKEGMVVVPSGTYLITTLFFKDDITFNITKGAKLLASTNRYDYPYMKDSIENNGTELVMGSWEGNPGDSFFSPITILNVNNFKLIGEGTVDCNSQNSDWWDDPKRKIVAFRPRGMFISYSQNIAVQGITIKNTASWTMHPFYSKGLDLIDMKVQNPSNSPNTDGCDPESCEDVNIIGLYFSVGDDCISLKSGKLYMAKKHYQPIRNVNIRNCYMNHGHGAVVIGSEMSCGAYNINVSKCIFDSTDRGLRIKTRRGRGNKAIIDNVSFDNILMKDVLNPFTVNMHYFCDPDGKSIYVSSKDALPVDERTPHIGSFEFSNINCFNSKVSASYFYGLKEMPIDKIKLSNVKVTMEKSDICEYPIMMDGIEKENCIGFYFNNVKSVELENVEITGQVGPKYIFENVNEVKGDK